MDKRKRTIIILMLCLMAVAIVFVVKSNADNDGKRAYERQLKKLAKDYPKVQKIIDEIDKYPETVLELVVKNPETIDYALGYPTSYPAKGHDIIVDEPITKGKIPLLMQWDKRWGYHKYGGKALAFTGCGPTCLSMVIMGLTGDTEQTPNVIANFSQENSYYVDGTGSRWALMAEGAKSFGLIPKELPLDKNIMLKRLKNGTPIIISVSKGDFTTAGHYIVLTGVVEDGKVTVNDPNSIKRSQMTWDLESIMKQIKNLWSFEVKTE